MAILPLVLRTWVQIAQRDAHQGRALSRALQPLQRQVDAVHAVLSLVPPKGAQTLAGPAVSRGLRRLQVVGRFGILDILSLV